MSITLDESSLASTKHIHKLFARLEPEDKVLLVGDVRQHQAVEAGSPFEQLQQYSMTTAALTENVRQRDEDLKQNVEDLAARNTPEAVAALVSRGKVIEIPDERERFEAIARDYAKNPIGTLVISPANRERSELNSLIHRELQREGIVSRNDQQTTVYVSRSDMTGPERTFANSYRPNEDIIRYNSASEKLKVKAGDYARVIDTDHETQSVPLPKATAFKSALRLERNGSLMAHSVRSRRSNPTEYVWRWIAGARLAWIFASFVTLITATPLPAIRLRG